eukprot:8522949-Lingulodinium_polyedra.AAC.1
MRQPRFTASVKTWAAPSVRQLQRRPQQGTCHSPEDWEPPCVLESETRMKSQERVGNSWQTLQ